MFWPRGKCLAYSLINFFNLSIIFPSFLHNTSYVTWTTPSFNCKHPSMCMHVPLTLHVSTSYIVFMVMNALEPLVQFVTPLPPLWDVGFHVKQEQLHALPSTTINSFCRWVDIVLTKYDIRTLANVAIVDPTQNTSESTSLILRNSRICCP
jgi:hypothetical protein